MRLTPKNKCKQTFTIQHHCSKVFNTQLKDPCRGQDQSLFFAIGIFWCSRLLSSNKQQGLFCQVDDTRMMYGGSFRLSGRRLGSSVGTEMAWKETAFSSNASMQSRLCRLVQVGTILHTLVQVGTILHTLVLPSHSAWLLYSSLYATHFAKSLPHCVK